MRSIIPKKRLLSFMAHEILVSMRKLGDTRFDVLMRMSWLQLHIKSQPTTTSLLISIPKFSVTQNSIPDVVCVLFLSLPKPMIKRSHVRSRNIIQIQNPPSANSANLKYSLYSLYFPKMHRIGSLAP
jgi:hypothetical protein